MNSLSRSKKLSYRHAITKVYVWSIPVVTLDTVAKIDYNSVMLGKHLKKVKGLYQEKFKRLHQI